MQTQTDANWLSRIPYLHEVPPEDLQTLVGALEACTLQAGETVYIQGQRPAEIAFILEGSLELLRETKDGATQRLALLGPGDSFGELEMVHRQPRTATARALEPTRLYLWRRAPLTAFMRRRPQALAALRFVAQSQRLLLKRRFPWLRADESVHALARKHSALLYESLTLPALLLALGAIALLWGLSSASSLLLWSGVAVGAAGLAFGVWQWVDWGNDYYVVTNRRAIWLEKAIGLYDSRRETPLYTVLSVGVNTNMTGRMLGYGDIILRTYTGKVTFHNLPQPNTMAAIIEELWRREQAQREATDREALSAALEERLTEQKPGAEAAAAPGGETGAEPVDEPHSALGRWGFQVRFEDGDVITYRKHWAVLLRELALPSALFMLIVVLIGARLGGWITFLETSAFILLAGLALVPIAIWWLYRYMDWANDLYQITPSQIIDLSKKPLAREERKVAPLANILGTEVDRKGIIGLMLNYGDVIANVGTEQFLFQGVFDPIGVQQDIVHAQEAWRERSVRQQRDRRQREMVELLDIYHDKFAPSGEDMGEDELNEHDTA